MTTLGQDPSITFACSSTRLRMQNGGILIRGSGAAEAALHFLHPRAMRYFRGVSFPKIYFLRFSSLSPEKQKRQKPRPSAKGFATTFKTIESFNQVQSKAHCRFMTEAHFLEWSQTAEGRSYSSSSSVLDVR